MCVCIDDQYPSPGNISVFLNTNYNIDSVSYLNHITISLHVMVYAAISIHRGSTMTH